MKIVSDLAASHSCMLPVRRVNYEATAIPEQKVLYCEECCQHWLATWDNYKVRGNGAPPWYAVNKPISARKAQRLMRRWKRP